MRTIFSNGCFDILHRGHIEMLQYAASLGDRLIVAIDTDIRVKNNKSPDRPINNETDRAFMLQSLGCVDMVHTFDSEAELRRLLKAYRPDKLVIGSEYLGKYVIGADLTNVTYFGKIDGYSTTNTIKSIANR